jgi:hypothetical protein
MRRYVLLFALALCGCIRSQLQSRAEDAAEHYVRSMLGNPKYFKSVSFSPLQKRRYTTALDSSLNYAGIDTGNHQKAKKYVDSENNQRPDIAVNNVKDLYNIEHDKLTYYLLIYAFRIDSNGYKKYIKYRFELDTACRILNARDITHSRQRIE